jgi:hypothetical protein
MQAIWWGEDLLLYQVKVPFMFSVSIKLSWSMSSQNLPLSFSNLFVPVLFSSIVRMILKSPPKIKCF